MVLQKFLNLIAKMADVATGNGIPTQADRKCVGIIGAGSAGMAAAWSLSRFPAHYDVHVIDPGEVVGGVACTLRRPLVNSNGDILLANINYGVQGGNFKAHQNTIEMMRAFGMKVTPAELAVSFGIGDHNWKNYERSDLQRRMQSEISRFGTVIKWIHRLEFITIFLSIDFVLRVCLFAGASELTTRQPSPTCISTYFLPRVS